MFENFSKFFANKKNLHIFIAALVIVTGIFLLKRAGLYEGMTSEPEPETETKKTPSSAKASPMG
jgi:hypothetical protein